MASPADANNKIGLKYRPTKSPKAPKNCKTMVKRLSFSSSKRLNSLFMWGDVKYETAYTRKEKLDIKALVINK